MDDDNAINDLGFPETLKVALYAAYGGRKTLQIGSIIDAVGGEHVLVISAERGLNTIKSKLRKDRVAVASNLPELRKAYETAKAFCSNGGDPRKLWVCVDGGSKITTWIANEQLSGAERYYDARAQNLEPDNALKPFGRFMDNKGQINTMQVYGRIGRDIENLLNAWIGLPVNLYVNFLEEKTGNSGFEKTLPYGPDVPGKVGLQAVMSSFDYVGRLAYNNERKIVAYFQPSNIQLARTREDQFAGVKVPAEIVDFDFAKFITLIQGAQPHSTATGS